MDAIKGLTEKQGQVLAFLNGYAVAHGHPPTVREIMRQFGFASPNSVAGHLRALERKGCVARTRGKPRAVAVVGQKSLRELVAAVLARLDSAADGTTVCEFVRDCTELADLRRVVGAGNGERP